ncbi:MAG: hypothetical protein C4334_09535 [Pyrinomonas sp.]
MFNLIQSSRARLLFICVFSFCLLSASGCGNLPGVKRRVPVAPLLTPLIEGETELLIAEVNKLAAVQSLRGKIDIQFLDTSFAECGVAEKYRTADGTVILERPGKIYLAIQAPFIGTSVAEMTSDGERFRVAVLQGDERYRRFVKGTNAAEYERLKINGMPQNCAENGKRDDEMNVKRTVSALSGLRPQHFTDALLIRPIQPGTSLLYARSEAFEDEPDPRPGAKKNARVVRGYYILDELESQEAGRARVVRRFWFDRYGALRLARMQTFDGRGQIVTDVRYRDPKPFGEQGRYVLPSRIQLTRPQDRYSIEVVYQAPEAVVLDRQYDPMLFVLQNKWQLPEVDLDARDQSAPAVKR